MSRKSQQQWSLILQRPNQQESLKCESFTRHASHKKHSSWLSYLALDKEEDRLWGVIWWGRRRQFVWWIWAGLPMVPQTGPATVDSQFSSSLSLSLVMPATTIKHYENSSSARKYDFFLSQTGMTGVRYPSTVHGHQRNQEQLQFSGSRQTQHHEGEEEE